MNKIWLIIQREFLIRIRSRVFIIMTFLGPVLFAALFILPGWLMALQDNQVKKIAVIDSTGVFLNKIPNTPHMKFEYLINTTVDEVRERFNTLDYYALLYIAPSIHNVPNAIQLMSFSQPSLAVSMHIANAIEKEIERQKLKTYNIENLGAILAAVKTTVNVRTIKWMRDGKDKAGHAGLAMAVSYVSGFLVYLFIFLFCTQVIRGVVEEKTSRIVEIICSSVKPFQLMMGKILGVALVALSQFLLWIILTVLIIGFYQHVQKPDVNHIAKEIVAKDIFSTSTMAPTQTVNTDEIEQIKDLLSEIWAIDFYVMLFSFLFYFIGGYLLYAAIFAAVGAMVDNETDTQQFILPVTIPLLLALFVMLNTINNPDSSLSVWFSFIPFTSPVVMMARIPYGVPYWQVFTSSLILILSFVFFTWLSSKIYRVGILMYGKKAGLKEIIRWISQPD